VRNAITIAQALLGNQINSIFAVMPLMPSVGEGNDIVLLAQQIGQPTLPFRGCVVAGADGEMRRTDSRIAGGVAK